MRLFCRSLVWLLLATTVQAQAPVEERFDREQAIQRGQHRAGAAYRELEEAQYQAKLAEQDYLNAQRQAEESKLRLNAAKKAHDEARAREARARKVYDDALTAVDQAFKRPPAKQ